MQRGYDLFKRLLDLLTATVGLVVLSPIILAEAIVVRIAIGSPAFFRQTRPGLNGKPFEMLKFRTMADTRSACGDLLPDAERLGRIGRFLRAASLDELPELINVLKGDMSLVGPRPLLMEYLQLYSPEQARRHDVRPGLTGWAQINGRNDLDWQDRLRLDVWYVDNRSLFLDLRIIMLTFKAVLCATNTTQRGHATVEKFRGNLS